MSDSREQRSFSLDLRRRSSGISPTEESWPMVNPKDGSRASEQIAAAPEVIFASVDRIWKSSPGLSTILGFPTRIGFADPPGFPDSYWFCRPTWVSRLGSPKDLICSADDLGEGCWTGRYRAAHCSTSC
ncbi:hypothetical protein U1Q18_047796 [Sarracenia purpurea var. burkii]